MLDFLGIGAQKAGTTWLYEILSQHPSLSFPAGKEAHFWDHREHSETAWYKNMFADDSRINGEITPAYAILPVHTIREIFYHYPALRLIYIIRNPLERAWSSAKMALRCAGMRMDEASDQWFIDHFRSGASLARGDYEQCIRNWCEVFPSEQLLILRHENLTNQPNAILAECCRHLGVENIFPGQVMVDVTRKVFAGAPEALRPSLLPVLHDLYDKKIASLESYLGQEFSNWMKP